LDPLTHTLTGVMLSRAGFDRWTPHAAWISVLAANAPDIDVLAWAGGSLAYLNWHRHFTHSLLAVPVMAALPLLLLRLVFRKRFPWRRAYLVALVAAATHPLLDLLNAYGIRLALPFTGRWYQLDVTYVVDVWITGALWLAALGPALSRMVSDEIGARRTAGRGWAWFGIAFLLLYNAGRGVLHERAVALTESRIYRGAAPQRVAAFPDPFTPWRWHGLAETATFYAMPEVNLLKPFDPDGGRVFFKAPRSDAIARASQAPAVRDYLRFAQYPIWSERPVSSPPDAVRVTVTDLRFSRPPQMRFVATALLDREGKIVSSEFRFEP
jgi:inner membrane protein